MTIAVGVLVNGAVVVGADTEHTWAYLKSSGTKVFYADGVGAIAITGSGTTGYIEKLSQELKGLFNSNPSDSAGLLFEKFQKHITGFFDTYIYPASVLPERPSLDIIVGIQRKGESRLWASTNDALRECGNYAVCGFGAEYAEGAIKKFLDPNVIDVAKIDRLIAERLAVYAIFITKESVQHCGIGTDVVSLEADKALPIDSGILQLLEGHFNRFLDLQFLGLHYISGYPYRNHGQALQHLSRYFDTIRSEVRSLEGIKTGLKPWSLE